MHLKVNKEIEIGLSLSDQDLLQGAQICGATDVEQDKFYKYSILIFCNLATTSVI